MLNIRMHLIKIIHIRRILMACAYINLKYKNWNLVIHYGGSTKYYKKTTYYTKTMDSYYLYNKNNELYSYYVDNNKFSPDYNKIVNALVLKGIRYQVGKKMNYKKLKY